MTARATTLMAMAAAACLFLGAATEAHDWDTAPWDPLPFDQPNQLDASSRAKVARVEAGAMARIGAAQGGKGKTGPSTSALVTDGQRGCTVSLGNVVLPQAVRGGADISTNVQIKGDVITVCH